MTKIDFLSNSLQKFDYVIITVLQVFNLSLHYNFWMNFMNCAQRTSTPQLYVCLFTSYITADLCSLTQNGFKTKFTSKNKKDDGFSPTLTVCHLLQLKVSWWVSVVWKIFLWKIIFCSKTLCSLMALELNFIEFQLCKLAV